MSTPMRPRLGRGPMADAERFAATLIDAVIEVKSVKTEDRLVAAQVVAERLEPIFSDEYGESLGLVFYTAHWLIEELRGQEYLEAALAVVGDREEAITALINAWTNSREAYWLVDMLGEESGERLLGFGAIVTAGRALGALRTVDPELAVAGPGIESKFKGPLRQKGTDVVEEIKRVVELALG